jgi:FkbM family methyltransferase
MESKSRQRVLTSGICALFLGLSWLVWAHTNLDSVAPNKVSQREAASEPMSPVLSFPCRSKRSTFPGSCPVRPASGVILGSGFENSSNFYSQGYEDRNVLERYFYNRTGGTFIEMGALDGLRYSNSFFFETELGWSGLLIEGNPKNYEYLEKNRPNALVANAMVCSSKGELHYVEHADTAINGIWEFMSAQFRERFYADMTPDRLNKTLKVPCLPLRSILDEFHVFHVDFFSLDVEGAEPSVLETVDFSKFSASVLVVENLQGDDTNGQVRKILFAQGYVEDASIGNNHVFLHPDFKRLRG